MEAGTERACLKALRKAVPKLRVEARPEVVHRDR